MTFGLKPTWITALLVLGIASACGGGDSDSNATATPPSAATQTDEATIAGSTATDGICVITIPDDWVDDGTGRGETALGDRWTLFGGAAATDDAWTSAKDLLKTQFGNQDGAEVVEVDSMISVSLANGGGLYVRERFEGRYCEFGVTSSRDNGDDIVQLWRSVADSLALAVP